MLTMTLHVTSSHVKLVDCCMVCKLLVVLELTVTVNFKNVHCVSLVNCEVNVHFDMDASLSNKCVYFISRDY